MPWAVAGAAIGAGASLIGGSMQANATGKAAANSTRQAYEFQHMTNQMTAPYRQVGQDAVHRVGDLSGANGLQAQQGAYEQFRHSPGFEYTMNNAMQGVQAGQAARGLLASGQTAMALQDRAVQLANQDFGNYYNRLLGLAQIGQNTALGSGAQNLQTAGNISQTTMAAGNAQANIYGNMASGVADAIGSGLNNYRYFNQQQPQNSLYSSAPVSTSAMATTGRAAGPV